MKKLFEPIRIGTLELQNRSVRSATWEGLASEDGSVTRALIDRMAELAAGRVGLIISGHVYVSPEGKAGPGQMGLYADEQIEGVRRMADAVHAEGGRIMLQLAHAGVAAIDSLVTGTPLSVSDTPKRKTITEEDVRHLVGAFGNAALRAQRAGCDGIQIHGAHGYLISQTLSGHFNHRTDAYGGPIRNRAAILLAICKGIRQAVGPDFPVFIKINSEDFLENGLTLDESLEVGKMLKDAGIDAVEISGGTISSGRFSPSRVGIKSPDKEAYFREAARRFRETSGLPVILVGGLRSPDLVEQMLEEGYADLVSFSRPLVREPDLIRRWQEGDLRPALCKSDNLCFAPGLEGKGIYCVTREREGANR